MNKLTKGQRAIIVAVIGVIGGIIVALIQTCKVQTIEVHLIDNETKKGISGEVFIDADKDGFTSIPENPAILKVKRWNRVIRAESEDYKPVFVPVKDVVKTRNIEMEKIAGAAVTKPVTLSLVGWNTWPSQKITLTKGAANNECIIKSNGKLTGAAGFNQTSLNAAQLRGKTLVLYFSNVGMSEFSLNRMAKITYNTDDFVLNPVNSFLLNEEYLPAEETPLDNGIEFPIPDDFDGKLGFVFFQADLKDLKITAYYK